MHQHQDDVVNTTIHLNNHGAWLLSIGDYQSAMQCLSEAFKHSRMIVASSSSSSSTSENNNSNTENDANREFEEECTLNYWMSTSAASSGSNNSKTTPCFDEDDNSNMIDQSSLLFRHPIYIPTTTATKFSNNTTASYNFRLSLSVALLFNLALVNQLLATTAAAAADTSAASQPVPVTTTTRHEYEQYVSQLVKYYHDKAISLYELGYKLLAKFRCTLFSDVDGIATATTTTTVGNELIIMAITNNLAWSCDMLNNNNNFNNVHRQRLQSLVMLYLSMNNNGNGNGYESTSSYSRIVEFFFTSSFVATNMRMVHHPHHHQQQQEGGKTFYLSCNPAAAA